MELLPVVPGSCSLDRVGVRAQGERYREVGRGARLVERSRQRLTVELGEGTEGRLVEELVAVERACCPFFELGWEPGRRRLSIGVSRQEDAPALDAVAFALGLDEQPV